MGDIISLRTILSAGLLACTALAATACGPEDGGGADAAPSHTAQADPKPTHPGGGQAHRDGGKPSGHATAPESTPGTCPKLKPGHRRIHVSAVTGAMNNITYRNAKMACSSTTGNGAAYRPTGPSRTHPWKPGSPITYITNKGTKHDSLGIAHVRACALKVDHPHGTGNEPLPDDLFCYGQNFYDVVVDGKGRIASMTELYGS